MTAGSRRLVSLLSIAALAACAFLVHDSSAFCSGWTRTSQRVLGYRESKTRHAAAATAAKSEGNDDGTRKNDDDDRQPPPLVRRKEATIRLKESGKEATLISRTLPVFPDGRSVTVWEWKNSARVVNAYWDAQGQIMATATTTNNNKKPLLLDPFGLVSWPGSVLAARELYQHAEHAVANQTVVVLGAGVGVETQAAAMLGPKQVIATDIHPTTLQQLQYGVEQNNQIPTTSIVTTRVLDLFLTKNEQPIPPCDLLVVADVLYSEQLASQVCRRCAEALEANPSIKILITDSQRFVPTFVEELNENLARVAAELSVPPPVAKWKLETMKDFEGSGVIIDEDQTYDVKVQSLWIGL